MNIDPISVTALGVSLVGTVVAWLVSDARSKARLEDAGEKVAKLDEEARDLSVRMVRVEAELEGVRRDLQAKASADVVAGMRDTLEAMRKDLHLLTREIHNFISQRRGDSNPGFSGGSGNG